MSNIPIFSYKDYLDKTLRLKDQGHVDADIQATNPISAGSRGLRRTKEFIKDPVHLMGESEEGRPTPAQPNAVEEKILDVPTATIPEIADKHRVSVKDILDQLKKGLRVEAEHTTDFKTAKEIALDHLNEFPNYYDRLAQAEKSITEDVVDIDKNFQIDLMKYLNLKMVQIEKQIVAKPIKTPEEQDDKDFAVNLFKFVQQKLAQQDAKNESREMTGTSLADANQ